MSLNLELSDSIHRGDLEKFKEILNTLSTVYYKKELIEYCNWSISQIIENKPENYKLINIYKEIINFLLKYCKEYNECQF